MRALLPEYINACHALSYWKVWWNCAGTGLRGGSLYQLRIHRFSGIRVLTMVQAGRYWPGHRGSLEGHQPRYGYIARRCPGAAGLFCFLQPGLKTM